MTSRVSLLRPSGPCSLPRSPNWTFGRTKRWSASQRSKRRPFCSSAPHLPREDRILGVRQAAAPPRRAAQTSQPQDIRHPQLCSHPVAAQGWPPKFTARVGDLPLSSHPLGAQGVPPKFTAETSDHRLPSHPVAAKGGRPSKFTARIGCP